MYINLSDLKEIGGRKNVSLELEFPDLEFVDRDIKIKDSVQLDLEIYNTRDSFVVKGILEAELILSCSRCLKKYSSPIKLDISEDVMKSEMEDEEELYLDDIIVDNIILSLPMKPLCSEDCKGICPECGQNLNEGECDCEVETVDPRLAKLKEFYNDNE
ncbi:COG1399 protein, clustered with ribosomal protein L32p [Halanaerobium saccharolyticum subsp. saccharolyticum DSM 6643]|uniref:COG1399 protein, clustered with ribosomal protein L32p n=1 Tax=Halanaerobium saccharolyticum subsp. saccharolyticum DSM 6643 TaxID=1293054 RepID=M5E1S2_9FIRM|nr:DUF177 domain-containing protein [Halanaerobium saccharolyticum]CCU79495.1 COG1399 protein, clustered with ribosomal protein L32p [Halanaerobium saccharolyticum subsp. saccharolyticum DSM 6643]